MTSNQLMVDYLCAWHCLLAFLSVLSVCMHLCIISMFFGLMIAYTVYTQLSSWESDGSQLDHV